MAAKQKISDKEVAQPLDTGRELPNAGGKLPDTGRKLPNTGRELPNAGRELPNAGGKLPDTGRELPNAGGELPNTGRDLPYTSTDLPHTSTDLPHTSKVLLHTSAQSPGVSTQAQCNDDPAHVEEILQYCFHDKNLLQQALTHSSYANDNTGTPANGNERLEFLGDAVLDVIIAEKLYRMLPNHDEGVLTKLKAAIVCESSLAAVSHKYGLHKHIRLSHGEQRLGGQDKDSIAADGMEALIGAVYLDGGRDAAQAIVLRILEDSISDALQGKLFKDYKTALQEVLFAKGIREIEYRKISETGPAHARVYTVQLFVQGVPEGSGVGPSLKRAEQNAAKATMAVLKSSQ